MFTRIYTSVTPQTVADEAFLIQADGGTVERQDQPDGTITLVATFPGDPPVMAASQFPWMRIAEGELGVHEGVNSDRIGEYFTATELGEQPDSVPWCSAFVNFCMQQSGQPRTRSARARSWLGWGEEANDWVPGCVVVLPRGGDPASGHVGFFAGFDAAHNVRLLGGNQRDSVAVHSFPEANNNFLGRRVLQNITPVPPRTGPAPVAGDVKALLIDAMNRHQINDNTLRAGIAAIAGGESGMVPHSELGWGRTVTRPNGLARARRFFSALHGLSDSDIIALAADDEAFFNTVYAGKIGNGDVASGDGFRYRGRGIFQLTGRENYRNYGGKLTPPVGLEDNPELANDVKVAVEVAVVYMLDRFDGGDFAAMKAAVGNSIGPPDANKDQLFAEYRASGEFDV